MKHNKIIKENLEEIYDMSSRKESVKSKIDFKEVKRTKSTFPQKLYLLYMAIIGIILISVSSFTTYLIVDNNYDHISSDNGYSNEYLKEAKQYLTKYFKIYDKYPIASYYINDSYIFNIYRGQYNQENDDIIYVCQIYNLSFKKDNITIRFKNSLNVEKQITKNKNEISTIEIINSKNFQIIKKYLFAIIEYNDIIYNQFQINI